MFSKTFNFRRKKSDETRQSRFQRNIEESPSPSPSRDPSPSHVSAATQEDHRRSVSSLSQISAHIAPQRHTDRSPRGRKSDPGSLGLNAIYTPERGHSADVVFIHGLGGASRRTWSKDEDPELFWPLKFLPSEPEVCLTRILTFGYNADFRATGKVSISVLDFAKDLLFDLKYAKGEHKEELNIGSVPLIFVVHSMGGLIIKEAYMQGQHDPEYESIIKAVSAIIFLATPHRGTNLAELLDRILRSSIISSPKEYVSELTKNSITLQKLNEQFRHVAPKLDIVSFYETQSTAIGTKKARIGKKDSSVLGYPGETSKALNADHHNVCKYSSTTDPNYITVRNALTALISKTILSGQPKKPLLFDRKESQDLKSLLAISDLPDTDYIFFRDQWTLGTNEWILKDHEFTKWSDPRESAYPILWIYGGPATGKSVLSSFIINNLVENHFCCQYFFIRCGDQKKRTLSLLLRSIAYQIVQGVPGFLQSVLQLRAEAIDFESADPKIIWERIFKSILLKKAHAQPLYWVIDGLDEADNPRAMVRLFSDIFRSVTQIRISFVSRKTPEITAAFQKLPDMLNPRLVSIEGHIEDLHRHISEELSMFGSIEFKKNVVRRVVSGAQNNFLWVRLAVEKLNTCHTDADVEFALSQLPIGMEALYDRMASAIAQNLSPTDRASASTILECVTCSLRALTVAELSEALHEDASKMLDFQRSIIDLCYGFIVIDNGGNIAMIHQTAREYLLSANKDRPFRVEKDGAHRQLFLNCMRALMAVGLRAKIKGQQQPHFLDYAAKSWSSHLALSSLGCEEVRGVLKKFLTSTWVLTWIQILATSGQLRVLIQASKNLSRYAGKQNVYDTKKNKKGQHTVENELIESWSEDFIKIAGKFSRSLRENPESIYKLIPPFCPPKSAIYQQFGNPKDKTLSISGLSTKNWDDSLARLSLEFGTYATSILAAGTQIAILVPSGSVVLYDSSLFEQATSNPINHGERIYRMELNNTGTLLVTYGYRTTKIWEISSGKCTVSVNNLDTRPRPLAMRLINHSSMLVVGTDDRRIRSLNLNQPEPTWQLLVELEEPELEGHFLNSSNYMALNEDASLIAVAYRGHPFSAWETGGPVHIGHCWRKRKEVARGEVIEAVWHPHHPEILGLYIEGVVFKWKPYDDETEELATGASRLAISWDGNLFATGDVRGTVKVYTTSDFSLLYQLSSEDIVLGLAFSPDLCRFYDIRGHYGNAWEPNALMKYAEQRNREVENQSEVDSIIQAPMTFESLSGRIDSITVVASSPVGRFCCCGTEKGTVRLQDIELGKIDVLHTSKGYLSIERMSWSHDGRLLCFSDSSNRIFVTLIIPQAGQPVFLFEKNEITFRSSTNGHILQLLFRQGSNQLLVSSSSTLYVISLDSYSVLYSSEFQTAECRWIIHPCDDSLVMGVEPDVFHVLDWRLTKLRRHNFKTSHDWQKPVSPNSCENQNVVDRVLVTQDKRHLLVQMSSSKKQPNERAFLVFESSWFKAFAETSTEDTRLKAQSMLLCPVILPRGLSCQIIDALCFLSRDNLIVLSKNFWLCSWRPLEIPLSFSSVSKSHPVSLPGTEKTTLAGSDYHRARSGAGRSDIDDPKPIFPLPGDWISRNSLSLCCIWAKERSLLCPRNGELAVVKCAALI